MAYIDGSNLRIFPATTREAEGRTFDNWLTEFNLSSIINQLVGSGCDGFVITEEVAEDQPIEFNIEGYYFKVDKASIIKEAVDDETSSESSTDETNKTNFVTFCKDEDGYYTALIKISDSDNTNAPILLGKDGSEEEVSGGKSKSLKLFKVTAAQEYIVPLESRLSFITLQNLTVEGKATIKNLTVKGTVDIDDGDIG